MSDTSIPQEQSRNEQVVLDALLEAGYSLDQAKLMIEVGREPIAYSNWVTWPTLHHVAGSTWSIRINGTGVMPRRALIVLPASSLNIEPAIAVREP